MRWLKHIGFIIGLVALAGTGCSSPNVSVSPTAKGPPLPPELSKSVLSDLGVSLSVHLYLNNDEERVVEKIKVSDDGRTLTDFQITLPVGTHSLYLEYLITDLTCRPGPIKVARTTTLRDVVISVGAPTIDFSSATIALVFDDDADGVSNATEWQEGTFTCVTAPGSAAPAAPAKLQLMPGDRQITVQWESVDGATAYNVYYAVTPNLNPANYKKLGGTRIAGVSSPHTIRELSNDTRYYILVTANNAAAESVPVVGSVVPAAAPATEFSVNVRLSGLQGTLVLSNGSEDLSVTGNSTFAFPTLLPNGTVYNVAVKTPPANQTCTVGAGAQGTIESAHVFGIDVSCDFPLHKVFVTVAGLQGNGLVLQNNGQDDLLVTATGQVRFATQLVTGQRYGVSVRTQPTISGGKPEYCVVAESSGVMQLTDVTAVRVACFVPSLTNYTIGGAVNGLKGQIVLRNGSEDLIVTRGGAFRFTLPLLSRVNYNVAIVQQPSAQACTISNTTGAVATANIDNIVVTCSDALVLDANPFSREVELTWNGNDAMAYHLYWSTDPNCDLANYASCAGGRLILNVASPYRLTGLDNDQTHYFRLEARYPAMPAMLSQQVRARPGALHPNGPVLDIQVAGDGTMYLAGEFSRFMSGPVRGSATLDLGSGRSNSAFTVEGHVNAVIPDGTGGWYIGGAFSRVNGVARQNLAHLWADDSLDYVFDVPVTGEAVHALVLHGNRLYVGGAFTTVGVDNRPNLASIDLDTRSVTGWTPAPNGKVNALAAQGRRVFVGGEFTEIGEATQRVPNHAPVAAFDDSGALLSWNPTMSMSDSTAPTVRAITAGAGRIYVAGTFNGLGGETVDSLAGFLDNDALDQPWLFVDSDVNTAFISQLVFVEPSLYILGSPEYLDWAGKSFFLSLDPATGTTLKTINSPIQLPKVLTANATTLFVSNFNESSGITSIAAIEVIGGGQVVWVKDPASNGGINALALDGERLFVGSQAEMQWHDRGGVERVGVAALSKDGHLLEWKPRLNSFVKKLAVTDSAVYMMGHFNTVNGEERHGGVAAVDHTGTLLGWYPGKLGVIPFWEIWDMIAVNDTVYFGGQFREFAGSIRPYAAAIDANGSLTGWAPTPNQAVFVLADGGNGAIFLGGEFTEVGGAAHGYLAAVDAQGVGAVDHSWVVNANNFVYSLVRSGPDTLYVGGAFSTLNGKAGTGPIAMVSVGGTVNDPVNPAGVGITGEVKKMTLSGEALIAAGSFNAVDGNSRPGLVALGKSILDVLPWNPAPEGGTFAIAPYPTNGTIYLGGNFRYVEGRLQPHLAEVPAPTP